MEFSEEIENKATEFGISNGESALNILEHEHKFYWSIRDWDGFCCKGWEQIPKSLFDELTKYETERVSSMANKNLTQDLADLAKSIDFKVDDVVFFVAEKGGYLNDIAFKTPRMSVVRSIDFHCVKDKSYCLVKLADHKNSDYVTVDPRFIFPEREYKKAVEKLKELNQGEEQ